MHRPTKVSNLDVSLRIQQQVLRLDISVDDLEREIMIRLEVERILNSGGADLLAVAVGEGVGHLVDVPG